ncbi:hypothetical protein AX14_001818 [Amanita brunnescens Koide BX004]|nr:hypothetical protein AX14_001818 [Amanita brunnescens Koide BX004]
MVTASDGSLSDDGPDEPLKEAQIVSGQWTHVHNSDTLRLGLEILFFVILKAAGLPTSSVREEFMVNRIFKTETGSRGRKRAVDRAMVEEESI